MNSNVISARKSFSESREATSVTVQIRFNYEGIPAAGSRGSFIRIYGKNGEFVKVGFWVTSGRAFLGYDTPGTNPIPLKYEISQDTWYQVALKNIDYSKEVYDLYLDGVLVKNDLSFTSSAAGITKISLESDEMKSYFDNVILEKVDFEEEAQLTISSKSYMKGEFEGVQVGVSPADTNGNSDGTTKFQRLYKTGDTVTLSIKNLEGEEDCQITINGTNYAFDSWKSNAAGNIVKRSGPCHGRGTIEMEIVGQNPEVIARFEGGEELQLPNADFSYSPSNPTTQDTVQFTDKSNDPDGTIESWEWDFGDGKSSTSQNPTYQYSSNGNYIVKLTVTDNDGLTDSVTKTVNVLESQKDLALTKLRFSPRRPQLGGTVQILINLKNIGNGTILDTPCQIEVYFIDVPDEGRDLPGVQRSENITVRKLSISKHISNLHAEEGMELSFSVSTLQEKKVPLIYADEVRVKAILPEINEIDQTNNVSFNQNFAVTIPEDRKELILASTIAVESVLKEQLIDPFKSENQAIHKMGELEPQLVVIGSMTVSYITLVYATTYLAMNSSAVSSYFSELATWLSKWAAWNAITQRLREEAIKLYDDIKSAADHLWDISEEVWEMVTKEWVKEELFSAIEAIKQDLINVTTAIQERLITAEKAIEEGLIDAATAVKKGLISAGNAVKNGFISSWELMQRGLLNTGKFFGLLSPAYMIIQDDQRRRVGYINGKKITEIPGSSVYLKGHEIYVELSESTNDYEVIITGTGSGNITFQMASAEDGVVKAIRYKDIAIKEGSSLRVDSFDNNPEGKMELDEDGDGNYETLINPDDAINVTPDTHNQISEAIASHQSGCPSNVKNPDKFICRKEIYFATWLYLSDEQVPHTGGKRIDLKTLKKLTSYYLTKTAIDQPPSNITESNVTSELSSLITNKKTADDLKVKWSQSGIFPNPLNTNETTLYIEGNPQRVQVKIYDLSGRLVYNSGKLTYSSPGIELNLDELDNGVYLYVIKAFKDGQIKASEVKKLLIIR